MPRHRKHYKRWQLVSKPRTCSTSPRTRRAMASLQASLRRPSSPPHPPRRIYSQGHQATRWTTSSPSSAAQVSARLPPRPQTATRWAGSASGRHPCPPHPQRLQCSNPPHPNSHSSRRTICWACSRRRLCGGWCSGVYPVLSRRMCTLRVIYIVMRTFSLGWLSHCSRAATVCRSGVCNFCESSWVSAPELTSAFALAL